MIEKYHRIPLVQTYLRPGCVVGHPGLPYLDRPEGHAADDLEDEEELGRKVIVPLGGGGSRQRLHNLGLVQLRDYPADLNPHVRDVVLNINRIIKLINMAITSCHKAG